MELRVLRYFLALAEELHLGRASERVHIEQSPLSRSISQLEDRLGIKLFVRTGRGTQLTAAGELLRDRAREILAQAERTRRELLALGGGHPVLRVGICDGIAQPRLSVLLARWRATVVDVALQAIELPAFQMHEALYTERVDLCISFGVGTGNGTGLTVHPVWDEPIVAVMPEGHALAGLTALTIADAVMHPLVLCEPRLKPGFVAQLEQLLSPYAERLRIADRADTIAGALLKIGAGWGLGFLDAAHAGMLKETHLLQVPLTDTGARMVTYAVTKKQRDDELFRAALRLLQMARQE